MRQSAVSDTEDRGEKRSKTFQGLLKDNHAAQSDLSD